jgi:hypothetical protein
MKNVLWTGGWDSTFRVLHLVFARREPVQPYYVIDKARPSTRMELATMDRIRQMIAQKGRQAESLLRPTIVVEMEDIPEDQEITGSFQKLLSLSHLGSQYDWLSRFAHSRGLNDLELCIHLDDKAEGFLKNDVHLVADGDYSVLNDHPSRAELEIFRCFHFPLLNMSKLRMGEVAKANGYQQIMEKTWFCFRPTKRGKPCGECNPCNYTREEGLGRRVPPPPFTRRIKRFAEKVKRKIVHAFHAG